MRSEVSVQPFLVQWHFKRGVEAGNINRHDMEWTTQACKQFCTAVLQPAVLSWHFRFKFPIPARQGLNSPLPRKRTTVKCPWVARGMLKLSNWSWHKMDFTDNNEVPFCFKSRWGLKNHEKPEIDFVIRSRLYFCETHRPHVLSLNDIWLDSSINDSDIQLQFTATHLYGEIKLAEKVLFSFTFPRTSITSLFKSLRIINRIFSALGWK